MGRPTTVCVVGGGGREHALARTLARSADVVVTPGNPGMPAVTTEGHRITVTPASPEEVDADRVVVGPGADGARLEGSKAFMKELLDEARVPTARFGVFEQVDEAVRFLRSLPG